ncbi:MAG: thymidylate kinase [Candidatus Thermoplasmatota archaeon]
MKLVIIDGLDGVGKDTHAQLIKRRYEDKGLKVLVRSHPESDNFYGRTAKKALLKTGLLNHIKASLFYALDILYSLKCYYYSKDSDIDILIMVRYLMGTAYLPRRLVGLSYLFFIRFVPLSDYMFFLDADPVVLSSRVKGRSEIEMFENLDEFIKLRAKAIMLVNKWREHWHIIDTSGSIDETYGSISCILDELDKKE